MYFIDIDSFICYISITYLENFWTIRLTDSLYAKYDGSSADSNLSRAPFVIIMKKGVYMNQKKLKDLNLMDDFLFQAVMTYPDIGELFAKGFWNWSFTDNSRIWQLLHRKYTVEWTQIYGVQDWIFM